MIKAMCYIWHNFKASIIGWCAFAFRHPLSSVSLLAKRALYTLTRKMNGTWTDPFGFTINSRETLVSYWTILIMRDLSHKSWVNPIRSAESPHVIDVGANAGVFVHYIQTLNKNAVILAVEPQDCLANRIQDYAITQNANIRCIPAACSDHEGTVTLHLNYDGDTSASLLPHYEIPHSRSQQVPLVTLDQIAPPKEVFLLKIDAEGHGLEVLKGGQNTLKRTRYVLLEITKEIELITTKKLLGPEWNSFALGPADYLFINHNANTKDYSTKSVT